MHTHYMACFHVSPSKLLTAAAMLNTSEENQKEFTASAKGLLVALYESWMVVAVTAEKNVATVVRFNRFVAPCFCAKRIVGTPFHRQC
jgi:hypothetical protein